MTILPTRGFTVILIKLIRILKEDAGHFLNVLHRDGLIEILSFIIALIFLSRCVIISLLLRI